MHVMGMIGICACCHLYFVRGCTCLMNLRTTCAHTHAHTTPQAWESMLRFAAGHATAYFHKYLTAETAEAASYNVHSIMHNTEQVRRGTSSKVDIKTIIKILVTCPCYNGLPILLF